MSTACRRRGRGGGGCDAPVAGVGVIGQLTVRRSVGVSEAVCIVAVVLAGAEGGGDECSALLLGVRAVGGGGVGGC